MVNIWYRKMTNRQSTTITIAAEIFPPSNGGPATYVKSVVPTLQKHGFVFRAVTFGAKNTIDDVGIQTQCIPLSWPLPIRWFVYFVQLFKSVKSADLMLVMGTFLAGIPAVIIKKILHVPIVLRVPGDFVWERARHAKHITDDLDTFYTKKYSKKIEIMRSLQLWVVRSVDAVYVTSDYLFHVAHRYWGVSKEKIVVIYSNFSEPEALDINKTVTLPHILPNKKTILIPARLADWKGHKKLLELLHDWLLQHTQWQLLFAGEGPLRPELEAYITDHALESSVHLLGSVPKSELFRYYKNVDAVLLYSEYEGLSHVLLEAAYFHVPIIASAKAGNVELVTKYSRGTLVAWGDSQELIAACESLEQLAQQPISKSFFDIYSEKKMISSVVDLFTHYAKNKQT